MKSIADLLCSTRATLERHKYITDVLDAVYLTFKSVKCPRIDDGSATESVRSVLCRGHLTWSAVIDLMQY